MPEASTRSNWTPSGGRVRVPRRRHERTRWRAGVLDWPASRVRAGARSARRGSRGCSAAAWRADYELTAYEPDTRIAFRAIAGRATGRLLRARGGRRRDARTFALSCTPTASRG